MTTNTTSPRAEPRLIINFADYDRLAALADAAHARNAAVARDLLHELDRATIVPPADFPPEAVAMHSTVTFRDEQTGHAQRVTLVYPNEADIAEGRVSVLTPVGAALIGLSEGQTMSWEARTGERRSLTVLEVTPPRSALGAAVGA
jgi:regulator of nucleoside diphosphate kinase